MGGGGWGGRRQLGVAEISPAKARPAEAMETSPGGRQVQPLEKERGFKTGQKCCVTNLIG